MKYIDYKENTLFCEDVPLSELAEEYGTPLYVYSKNQILDNIKNIKSVIDGTEHIIFYALKANANHYLLKLIASEGIGADIVSGGELYLALKAGFAPNKIVFAGVGKREDEIEYALKQNIFCFNVESMAELQVISRSAIRLNQKARISLRINPDIDAESHPYITTGLNSNKFGIEASKAFEAYKFASSLPSLEIIGIHTHIGSQIIKKEPYVATAKFLVDLVSELRKVGINLSIINIGGGFGVNYFDAVSNEVLPHEENQNGWSVSPNDILSDILPLLQSVECKVCLEPGRSMVANSGVLLTKLITVKENSTKKFYIVDGGMNDLLRPTLYQAYHQIVPLSVQTYEYEKVDIVGPICESSDFFAHDRLITKSKTGDILGILTTGAYGYVMTSNYNGRPKPAEILVNGNKVRVIRPRQTIEELD